MSGVISTSVTGVDASGNAVVYIPPQVIPVVTGYNVVNGTYQMVPAGDAWPPSPGVWQTNGASGSSTVAQALTYRGVTITPL